MSDTAAIRNVFISPARLFIVMSYSFITGIKALMKPPIINKEDKPTVIINDHLRKRKILSPLMIPGILNIRNRISDIRKNINPYSMNASQKPPRILRASDITEECLDSRILAAINITARKKKVIE